MNGSLIKKLTAAALSAVLLVTGTTMSANAKSLENDIASYNNEELEVSAALYSTGFELQYVDSRAPLGANYTGRTYTYSATGNDYFTIRCTYFNQQLTNHGYLTEQASNITPVPVYGIGAHKVRYTGTSIPRQGTRMQVYLSLKNYSDENPMCVRGSIE